MKTLLICPDPQPAVPSLSEKLPLAALPLLGSSVVESWLIHFAGIGHQEIVIYANDRADIIQSMVGCGRRWGLKVDVVWVPWQQIDPALTDVSIKASAQVKTPFDYIEVMDHLPNQPLTKIFASYANWFQAVLDRRPHALTADRIGMREISAGIFVGHQSRISSGARLSAPCWIGNQVVVASSAVIGPETVIEDRSIIKKGARILHSIIGPDTLVGADTEIKDSLVFGERLINWSSGSSIRVMDVFLLSALHAGPVVKEVRPPVPFPQPVEKHSEKYLQQNIYTPIPENESIAI